MSTNQTETQSQPISNAIRELLEEGLTAALATLMDSPKAESNEARVGAKLLVKESGDKVGSLGNDELDSVVTQHSLAFLRARDDAKTFRVVEFAPQLEQFSGALGGGVAIEDPPGMREASFGKLYLAYLRDPDGNKLCGLHRPEQ